MQSFYLKSLCVLMNILFIASTLMAVPLIGPDFEPKIDLSNHSSFLSITCPPPLMISCDQDEVYQSFADFVNAGGSVNLPNNCDVLLFFHVEDQITTNTACSVTLLRTYEVETSCGSSFSCNQLVVLTDNENPIITSCPTDTIFYVDEKSCEVSFQPINPIADDDCGMIDISHNSPSHFQFGTTKIVYTVTDECGNTIQCSSEVEVRDTIPPVIMCPNELKTQCNAADVPVFSDVQSFVDAQGNIIDNCTHTITDFSISTQNDSSDGGSCPETVTRTYVITDAAGNSASCTQTIFVDDTVSPTFDPPPSLTNISCNDVNNLNVAGVPQNVSDNCTNLPTINHDDEFSLNNGILTITRTWTIEDECNNSSSFVQTITTNDTSPPVAICQDVIVYLPKSGTLAFDPILLDAGSFDDCSNELIFSASETMFSCNSLISSPFSVDLFVMNASGLSDTCSAMVTLLDTIKPTLTSPLPDTFSCIEEIDEPFENLGEFMVDGGIVDDNCVNGTISMLSADTMTANCPMIITRIYEYVDPLNVFRDTADHVIVIQDDIPPVILCPGNIVITQTDICDTLLSITAMATDNCGLVNVTNTFPGDANGDDEVNASFSGGSTQVQFIASDFCGNTDTCILTVTVNSNPKLSLPNGITDPLAMPYQNFMDFLDAGGSYNEDCGIDTSSFVHTIEFTINPLDSCQGTIKEIFSVGGNGIQCKDSLETIIIDTIPPKIDCVQPTIFGIYDDSCVANFYLIAPISFDNFHISSSEIVPKNISINTTEAYWVVRDACGNIDSCEVDIVLIDPTSPIIQIDTAMVMCDEMIPQYETVNEFLASPYNPIISDCNLDSSSFHYIKDTMVNLSMGKLYTVQDIFGNESEVIHYYEVLDITDPMILICTNDTVVSTSQNSCDAYVQFLPIHASDNCLDSLNITNDYNNSDDASDTYPIGTTIVTWTIKDANGGSTTCSSEVTVIDDIVPHVSCPDSIYVQCNISEVAPIISFEEFIGIGGSVFDNCQLDSTTFNSSILRINHLNCPSIYQRTFVISDTVGNMSSCSQTIIIQDTIPPIVVNADTITLYSDSLICGVDTSLVFPSATDNCGIDTSYISRKDSVSGTFYPVGFTEITYNYLDSCSNSTSVEQFIHVLDTFPPKILKEVDTIFVSCHTQVQDTLRTMEDILKNGGEIFDNCTYILELNSTTGTDTLTREYSIVDASGNSTLLYQIIARYDFEGPIFDSIAIPILSISCFENLPIQESRTASDTSGILSIQFDTIIPINNDVCLTREFQYIWIAIDSCGVESRDSLSFQVLKDSIAPEMVNLSDTLIINTDQTICGVVLSNIALPVVVDQCSGVDTLYSEYPKDRGNTFAIIPMGIDSIEWITVDQCGNRDTTIQIVNIVDRESPMLQCKNSMSINLTDSIGNLVEATTFINSSSDNCGIESILARRVKISCNNNQSTIFNTHVTFCCEDIGDTVEVEVQVLDSTGNENICQVSVVINDKIVPFVEIPLPNIHISCGFPIDLNNLDVFGKYDFDQNHRDSIILDDKLYESTYGYAGLDGLIYENCMASISDSIVVDIDQCNEGTIYRYFIAIDNSGNSLQIQPQIITITNENPFNENFTNIQWPENYIWDQCMQPPPDSSISGAPIISNDGACSLVGTSYSDQFFEIANGGCAFVRRTWKVIDWCQYDETKSPNPGLWTYLQIISVENKTSPKFDNSGIDTLLCIYNEECNSSYKGKVSARDDCTDVSEIKYRYEIDKGQNGSIETTGNGDEIELFSEMENFYIHWYANDNCGNVSQKTDTITIRDCQLPSPVCYNGYSISVGNTKSVEVWASDLNRASYDNCSSRENLIVSFSEDTTDVLRIYNCDSIGERFVDMWVTDEVGNQTFCTAKILIQDLNDFCDNNLFINISGQVSTSLGTNIKDAKVSIRGAEYSDYIMTNQNGEYAFSDIYSETKLELDVNKNTDCIEGINTLDLVLIMRHILGKEQFVNPYQYISADVNNDERISPSDLLELRKLILGIKSCFSNNSSWRFLLKSKHSIDPWSLPEDIVIDHGDTIVNSHFIGVKVGDVNHSVDKLLNEKPNTTRSQNYYGLITNKLRYIKGEVIHIPIRMSTDLGAVGLQSTLEYDFEKLHFIEMKSNTIHFHHDNVHIQKDGKITFLWHSKNDYLDLLANEELVNISFIALEDGYIENSLMINSSVTKAEIYDEDHQKYTLVLDYISNNAPTLQLSQNKPNPFSDRTIVEFDLPEDMEITFTICDINGLEYWNNSQAYSKGKHELKIDQELNAQKGVFILRMESAEFSKAIKMIKLK